MEARANPPSLPKAIVTPPAPPLYAFVKTPKPTTKPNSPSNIVAGNQNVVGNTVPGNNNILGGNVTAPNGIAIGRDNFGSPTVTNTFSDKYPRPGTIPNVDFCVFQSKPVSEQYETIITIKTDTEISAPFWGLVFDGPVFGATVAINDIQEPFGSTNGHPFPPGRRVDPLGTLPVKSRILLSANADATLPEPDDILRVQITEIGNPFGGPYRPWGPKDRLTVTIQSKQSIHLLAITSGYGREFIEEKMAIQCNP